MSVTLSRQTNLTVLIKLQSKKLPFFQFLAGISGLSPDSLYRYIQPKRWMDDKDQKIQIVEEGRLFAQITETPINPHY